MTFSYNEYQAIFHLILEGGLQAVNICQSMHWEIVHRPLKYQGLGIPSLYMMQGITHVEALLDAQPAKEIMGKLLICSVEDLKVKVVYQACSFNMTFTDCNRQ